MQQHCHSTQNCALLALTSTGLHRHWPVPCHRNTKQSTTQDGVRGVVVRMADNPCRKPPATARPLPKPKAVQARHGLAQEEFIDRMRTAVKDDPTHLETHDWQHLSVCGATTLCSAKKTSPNCFCVKDVAMWMPHMTTPGCTPPCPECESKVAVDPKRFHLVEFPKMLCGVNAHRHLDTVCCWCAECKGEFLGWHERTLQLDANEIACTVNFRTSAGFAVDEELCSFVSANNKNATASMRQRLEQMHADRWVCLQTFCCRALSLGRIVPQNISRVEGTKQGTSLPHLKPKPQLTKEQKKHLQSGTCLIWNETQSQRNRCWKETSVLDRCWGKRRIGIV